MQVKDNIYAMVYLDVDGNCFLYETESKDDLREGATFKYKLEVSPKNHVRLVNEDGIDFLLVVYDVMKENIKEQYTRLLFFEDVNNPKNNRTVLVTVDLADKYFEKLSINVPKHPLI